MISYKIIANVRRVGAIGIFYPMDFVVQAHDDVEAKERYFKTFSSDWEFFNFISIKPLT
jgi:hypothetical protein